MVQARTRAAFPLRAVLVLLAVLVAAPFTAAQQAIGADGVGAPPSVHDADVEAIQAKLAAQRKRLEELEAILRAGALPASAESADAPDAKKADPKPLDDAAVKKIVETYLKENPGVGVPAGVQNGYSPTKGFYIDSTPDPKWSNWNDDCKIPFELRIHGRIQVLYQYYQVTDNRNHLTGLPANQPAGTPLNPAIGGPNSSPNLSQLEIERGRLFIDGTLFDPNLRYRIDLEGNTRGVLATAGGGVPAGNGTNSTGGVPGVPDGNTVATVDHAVRLNGAYIAYDMHPCWGSKGCGPDCCEGTYLYTPTVTAFAGVFKPFMGLEETLLPFSCQFVEFSMASWFFDADDDAWLMQAGFQAKALDDRLYVDAMLTNGNEAATASNLQLDDLPGFNGGFWYDFGGTWNADKKKWDLWGDCIADIDYSCNPVVRVGGAVNLVPMDRRSEYDNTELNRIRVVPGAPGGTTLLNMLNGGGVGVTNSSNVGQFAIDAADEYTFNTFIAGKWHGFSLSNDWWFRDVDNLRGRRNPPSATGAAVYPGNGTDQAILYTSNIGGVSTASLLPANIGLFDYGMELQGGYFLVPKKLEVAARWSYVRGDSGSINGNGTFSLLNATQKAAMGIPAATTVRAVNDAFRLDREADEYALCINYYFHRQLLKWQTDFSVYNGGNPAVGGQSAAGFIPGVDGWMIRTQIQFGF